MEYSIQKIGGSKIEIAFKLDKSEWDNCIQEAYKKTNKDISLKDLELVKCHLNC